MLKWVFGADTGPFRQSLQSMRDDVKKFSKSASSNLAGLFGVGAITAWASATLDAAGRIDDLSKRLGMSAESFQRLSYASKMSGGDMEVVGKAITTLTKNLAAAEQDGDKFADTAKALNVNLAELKEMSPEGQMVELARGYAESADKGAALGAIMKLLGKSGAEIVPMLAEGPEALTKTMEEATVATNNQIATMAKIGDAMDAMKSKSVSVLGDILDGFKLMGATAEWALNAMTNGTDFADKQFQKRRDSIDHAGEDTVEARQRAERAEQSAKVLAEIEKERKKLTEEIANLEEEARIRALALTEKLIDAEKRRKQLLREAFTLTGNDYLKKSAEILKVEKEIAGYRQEQAGVDKKAQDDKQQAIEKNAEAMRSLAEKSVELDRSNKLAGMSDTDKREMLKKERAQALKDSKDANARGDYKGGLESGNRAKELTGQIDEITRSIADKAQKDFDALNSRGPTIATSALADIGGGGTASMMESDYGRKTVDLLAIIAANTAGGSEGSKPPEPI